MCQLNIRFYGILNDFVPRGMRYKMNSIVISKDSSIKNIILNQGIPEEIITLILLNDEPVDLLHTVSEGDKIALYPEFKNINRTFFLKKLKYSNKNKKFILNGNLIKLAKILRGLGIDTIYKEKYSREELMSALLKEKRVMISEKNKELPKEIFFKFGSETEKIYFLDSVSLKDQVMEILEKYGIDNDRSIYDYSFDCNVKLTEKDRRLRIFNSFRVPKKDFLTLNNENNFCFDLRNSISYNYVN